MPLPGQSWQRKLCCLNWHQDDVKSEHRRQCSLPYYTSPATNCSHHLAVHFLGQSHHSKSCCQHCNQDRVSSKGGEGKTAAGPITPINHQQLLFYCALSRAFATGRMVQFPPQSYSVSLDSKEGWGMLVASHKRCLGQSQKLLPPPPPFPPPPPPPPLSISYPSQLFPPHCYFRKHTLLLSSTTSVSNPFPVLQQKAMLQFCHIFTAERYQQGSLHTHTCCDLPWSSESLLSLFPSLHNNSKFGEAFPI